MKKILFFVFCLLGLFVVISLYFKPYIFVYNNSEGVIYLYKSTGIKNVDPEIEQVDEAMRPIVIKKSGYEKVMLSWRDIKLVNGQIYLGWKTVNRVQPVSRRSGSVVFDISSGPGGCSYAIYIENEKDIIKPLGKTFCFGKIKTL